MRNDTTVDAAIDQLTDSAGRHLPSALRQTYIVCHIDAHQNICKHVLWLFISILDHRSFSSLTTAQQTIGSSTMTIRITITAFTLMTFTCAYAQTSRTAADIDGVIEYATPPELIADTIVTLIPNTNMALHKPETRDRIIPGLLKNIEKGTHPGTIIHRAHSMIMPLKANVPVKVFLKRFPDRDAYYPIAISPLPTEN